MFKKRITTLLASTILVGTLSVGCFGNGSNSSKITVSGSTSIGPTLEVLAEKYKEKNKDTSVDIQQVGSSAGLKNTIDGTSEIGMSSRDLKEEEKKTGLVETHIAIDGIAIITNKSNDLKNLTKEQVKDIFTGKIKNWKDVGGKDAPIVVVSREDGSGTRDGFQEIIGFKSENLVKDATISDGSGNIKSTVQGNENAIGYTSFGYLDDKINSLSIDGQQPTDKNVVAKKYPVARPFILVNKKDGLSEKGKEFLKYIISDEGQKLIESKGFISISK